MAAQLFRLALAIVLMLVTGAARALPIVNVPSTTDVCCFGDGTPYFAQSFLARGRIAEDLSFSISLLVT